MNTEEIIADVPKYTQFYTLEELDKRAIELSKKYNFEIREVGRSELNHPIYLIKAGNAERNAFVWGFPHPNEPVGSMTIDWLVNYFGSNPEALKETNYTWHFMYTADPDGTKLNEDWFKGKLTLEKYFSNFFRPPAHRMVDWTFPVKHNDFVWNAPLKETKVLMEIIDEIKPDLMYPLHNAGFGGAYFLSTKQFSPEYYENIKRLTEEIGIPLHLGEAEEEFMREIVKPFYFDFGFKDYYGNMVKLGRDPKKTLQHGDNSTFYLLGKNPDALVIKGEVPYFYSERIRDQSLSSITRKDLWLDFLKNSKRHLELVQPIISKIREKISSSSPWSYVINNSKEKWDSRSDAMEKYVCSSKDFERWANQAEVLDGIIGSYFYGGGLLFGQVKRAAMEANLPENDIDFLDEKILECSKKINSTTNWKVLPIRNLVQLQLGLLFETINALNN